MSKVFPDRRGNVRNVQIMVEPSKCSIKAIFLDRHVINLVVIVAAHDQELDKDKPGEDRDQGKALDELEGLPQ